ncbi:hypothetical protein [Streptomyces vilmorinianum]|uniref:hypothetical protein n=1 Tax=Streptomyces vilmorinianum TaxID=3051092 RepID=UPI0010FB537F|nr:hypothetical protein [Streptomyces vilmorinianum]
MADTGREARLREAVGELRRLLAEQGSAPAVVQGAGDADAHDRWALSRRAAAVRARELAVHETLEAGSGPRTLARTTSTGGRTGCGAGSRSASTTLVC